MSVPLDTPVRVTRDGFTFHGRFLSATPLGDGRTATSFQVTGAGATGFMVTAGTSVEVLPPLTFCA